MFESRMNVLTTVLLYDYLLYLKYNTSNIALSSKIFMHHSLIINLDFFLRAAACLAPIGADGQIGQIPKQYG